MEQNSRYLRYINKASIKKKITVLKFLDNSSRLNNKYKGVSLTIDSMARCLEEVFPGKWDLRFSKRIITSRDSNDEIYYSPAINRPYDVEFLIHFPKILITNSKERQHLITDLFIKLCAPNFTPNGFTFDNFKGFRMSATREEILSCYVHSHISSTNYKVKGFDSNNSAFKPQDFCKGSSEINQALLLLKCEYTEGNFKLFLMQLIEYLNWESLEGVPHIKMENVVGREVTETLSLNKLNDYFEELYNACKNTPKGKLDFILDSNQVKVVDNEKLEEYIKPYSTVNSYISDYIRRKDAKGNYFAYKNVPTDLPNNYLSSESKLETLTFMFREEEIKFNIKEAQEGFDQKFYVCKQIKDYVKQKIEKTIQTKRFRSHIIESINSSRNS